MRYSAGLRIAEKLNVVCLRKNNLLRRIHSINIGTQNRFTSAAAARALRLTQTICRAHIWSGCWHRLSFCTLLRLSMYPLALFDSAAFRGRGRNASCESCALANTYLFVATSKEEIIRSQIDVVKGL